MLEWEHLISFRLNKYCLLQNPPSMLILGASSPLTPCSLERRIPATGQGFLYILLFLNNIKIFLHFLIFVFPYLDSFICYRIPLSVMFGF